MKKLIVFALLFTIFIMSNLQAQEVSQPVKPDYWGTFCLVSQTVGNTNFFKVDLTQLPSEFEKVYFNFYYTEQDVFHTQIKAYNIEKDVAMIAVPKKYKVEDYRRFMGDMKKMTQTANVRFTLSEKESYLLTHKLAK